MFQKNFSYLIKLFNCSGLKLKINGKIGASGSAKTKSIVANFGKNSTNNKFLKLDFQKIEIKTKSGIFNIRLILCYN
jgi:hypothetical protein